MLNYMKDELKRIGWVGLSCIWTSSLAVCHVQWQWYTRWLTTDELSSDEWSLTQETLERLSIELTLCLLYRWKEDLVKRNLKGSYMFWIPMQQIKNKKVTTEPFPTCADYSLPPQIRTFSLVGLFYELFIYLV
jgi:hypothetical protein